MYYDINKIVKEEIEGIKKLLEALDSADIDQPKGSLVARTSQNGLVYHVKEYLTDGKRRSRKLGNEHNSEVIRYKQRAYNKKFREILLKDLELLQNIEGKYLSYDPDSIDGLLGSIIVDNTGMVNKNPGMMSNEEWQRKPYKRNGIKYNNDPNIAIDGQAVRSKSEVILYNLVEMLGIPKHYEEDIELYNESGERVYKNADFKLKDKRNVTVVLEHLGLLSDENYFENAMHKIRLLIRNGYKLNDTLLLSADDVNGKIDSFSISRMLKARFEIK